MKAIIKPIDKSILEKELNNERFVRKTNNGNNLIFIINHKNAPNVIREIGRLREETFRAAGGGTGLDCDLDEMDLNETPYEQLIVWNPIDKEIIGGYRYIHCDKVGYENGIPLLATTELFEFSKQFITDFLPYTIELGRSFVQPKYQPSTDNRKGLFSMDNLWDGLGALIVDNPNKKYFSGKMTMYRHYDIRARDYILQFLNHYFPDPDKLAWPHHEVKIVTDIISFEKELGSLSYKEGHRILNGHIRDFGEFIPPLVNSYMNTSGTMRNFGTAINDHFGDVDETGILMHIPDIYPTKKERHINSYLEEKSRT